MQLKRFRGRRLPDVMRQVREELGPEAVILHTRQDAGGLRRFLGRGGVEVLAAVDRPLPPPAPGLLPPLEPDVPRAALIRGVAAGADLAGMRVARAQPGLTDRGREGIRGQLDELRTLLIRLGGVALVGEEAKPLFGRLLTAGIDEPLALRIASGSGPDTVCSDGAADALQAALEGLIRIDSSPRGLRSGVIAAVGPAGAGKTTTLAKLAALAHLDGAAVHLVSLDDGGLGAPSPLETFGVIIGLPYTLAHTPDELATAIGGAARHGLVLVDSPGLSPLAAEALADLGARLRPARPTEVHLVLSATTKATDAQAAIHGFSAAGATHLLFTHLDETRDHGALLSVSAAGSLPLSYFSTGREVPTDIERATIRALVTRVLQGDMR